MRKLFVTVLLSLNIALFAQDYKDYYNHSITEWQKGAFYSALSYAEKACEVIENQYNSPFSFEVKLNLADISFVTGSYTKAIEIYNWLLKSNKFPNDSVHVSIQNNLGRCYLKLNNTSTAIPIFKSVIDSMYARGTSQPKQFSDVYGNLALAYTRAGQYEKAEESYLQSLEYAEKRYGKNDVHYAIDLSNYAQLKEITGDFSEAINLLRESIRIITGQLGDNHPYVATMLVNIAAISLKMGLLNQAQSLVEEAMKVESISNVPKISYAETLFRYAEIKSLRHESVDTLFQEAIGLFIDQYNQNLYLMSDDEKLQFLSSFNDKLNLYYNYILSVKSPSAELINYAFALRLATKGIIFKGGMDIRNKIVATHDSLLQGDYDRLLDLEKTMSIVEQTTDRDSLVAVRNMLLSHLSKKTDLTFPAMKIDSSAFSKLQTNIGKGTGAIEIIRIRKFTTELTDDYAYMAFVISPENGLSPERVIIDSTGKLERSALTKYYKELKSPHSDCYNSLFRPFVEALPGVKHILVSPDGLYYSVNLETLRNPNTDKFLLEEYEFKLVHSLSQYTVRNKDVHITKKILLGGDPQFNLAAKASNVGGIIKSLPGTRVEVEGIANLFKHAGWKVSRVEKSAVTLKNIVNGLPAGVMHLATHGYYVNGDVPAFFPMGFSTEVFQRNPYLRSGLLLSGSETIISADSLLADKNALMTAQDVLNLNLQGTKLVVLSACRSGSGQVENGEGLYGLERALFLAGAEDIVESLWDVSDYATPELMKVFYTEWLKNFDTYSALRAAKLAIMKKYKEPLFWGAFVAKNN